MNITFDEFAAMVVRSVKKELNDNVQYDATANSWRRGSLTVTLSNAGTRAQVTYVAEPGAHFGHSSSAGLPHDLTETGVERAATEIVSWLSSRNLYDR